jgi:hypothetical protein
MDLVGILRIVRNVISVVPHDTLREIALNCAEAEVGARISSRARRRRVMIHK